MTELKGDLAIKLVERTPKTIRFERFTPSQVGMVPTNVFRLRSRVVNNQAFLQRGCCCVGAMTASYTKIPRNLEFPQSDCYHPNLPPAMMANTSSNQECVLIKDFLQAEESMCFYSYWMTQEERNVP